MSHHHHHARGRIGQGRTANLADQPPEGQTARERLAWLIAAPDPIPHGPSLAKFGKWARLCAFKLALYFGGLFALAWALTRQ